MSDKPTMTTSAGAPVPDNQNSITAGPRGPVLMQDYQLIEKLALAVYLVRRRASTQSPYRNRYPRVAVKKSRCLELRA